MDKKQTGNLGETLAAQFLEDQGYEIMGRNFLIRGGEIDIVAKDKNYLVFVEVKTRYSHDFGLPIESITPFKIKSLLKTAKVYLSKVGWGDGPYRIDFVSVDFAQNKDKPQIELVKNITDFMFL